MKADIEALKRIAEAATAGPWCAEQCGEKCDAPVVGIAYRNDDTDCTSPMSGWLQPYNDDGSETDYYREAIAAEIMGVDGCSASSNAAFIAAANPAVVLALLSELASLRSEREGMGVGLKPFAEAADKPDRENKVSADQGKTWSLLPDSACLPLVQLGWCRRARALLQQGEGE